MSVGQPARLEKPHDRLGRQSPRVIECGSNSQRSGDDEQPWVRLKNRSGPLGSLSSRLTPQNQSPLPLWAFFGAVDVFEELVLPAATKSESGSRSNSSDSARVTSTFNVSFIVDPSRLRAMRHNCRNVASVCRVNRIPQLTVGSS